jgi:hypothetical protein
MGVSGQRHAPAALYPVRYPLDRRPEPVWTQGLEEKSFIPAGDRTPIVQPVVRHYTAWATAAPKVLLKDCKYKFLFTHIRLSL